MALILTLSSILLMSTSIYAARDIYKADFRAEGVRDEGRVPEFEPRAPLVPMLPRSAIEAQQNNDFTSVGILSALMVIVLGSGLTYLIAGRALRPVTVLSKEMEEIGENNLLRQVGVPPSNDEVSKLSRSFNHMILKLEKAFAAHKNFSANAAHELKTPLAAMIANLEVLQLDERPTLDEYKETLEDTLKNAHRLSDLVNDLLKLNAGQQVTVFEKIDAKAMFYNIAVELGPSIQSKNIRVDNRADDVQLFGDKPLLYRAFYNLIHNAVKYNKPSGVIVIAAAENSDSTTISIFDTGIGISEDHIENVFDPFYCVDKSRSRELGGSGLGLSIVKLVIEKHGGEIQMQSVPDLSTTIVIRLPKPIRETAC
jgi:signal transduction histidine kinase